MKRQRFFIRNLGAGIYLENFLIAAIASVLVMRLFLKAMGYPQISGAGLHIAHVLFGGFLMLMSIIVLLSFLSKSSVALAVIVGGVGFGLFIDEIGKFVTSDTNYFFRPAAALIYVTFVLIFLAIRSIQAGGDYTSQEYLMNALQEMKEAALHDGLDEEQRDRLLRYLEKCNLDTPLVGALMKSVSQTPLSPRKGPWVFTRIGNLMKNLYRRVTRMQTFRYALVTFFVIDILAKIIYVIVLIFFVGLGWEQIMDIRILERFTERVQNLSFVGWAQLASSFLAGIFTFLGLTRIRRSRLLAFKMFERSILVSIFITQVFIFYKEQFSALLGLFFNVFVLIALRFMIEQERSGMGKRAAKGGGLLRVE